VFSRSQKISQKLFPIGIALAKGIVAAERFSAGLNQTNEFNYEKN
jgi:hypothetical protein